MNETKDIYMLRLDHPQANNEEWWYYWDMLSDEEKLAVDPLQFVKEGGLG